MSRRDEQAGAGRVDPGGRPAQDAAAAPGADRNASRLALELRLASGRVETKLIKLERAIAHLDASVAEFDRARRELSRTAGGPDRR